MRTKFKQSILELMSEEISRADMNRKIISYFELTIAEFAQLKHEMKMSGMKFDGEVYGVTVYEEVPF